MQAISTILAIALPVLYALATVVSVLRFVSRGQRMGGVWRPLLVATVGIHAVSLAIRGFETGRCPLGTASEAVGLAAFALAAVYLVLEFQGGTRSTGILILPIAFVLEVFAVAFQGDAGPTKEALKSVWFSLHAFAAVLGVAALAVAFVHGVFYLLLYREIKAHRMGLLFRRLPPLATLSRMTQTANLIGWALLCVTIGAGYVWAIRADKLAVMHRDPVFHVTVYVWLAYTIGVIVRFVFGWRGRTTVFLSVCAFALLLVVLTLVSALWPSMHALR